MATPTALTAAKQELRSLMKKKLSMIPSTAVTSQSATIFKSIQELKPFQEAQRIGVYLSMPTGEVQTDPIVRHALNSGKQVFVPYLHKPPNPSPGTPKTVMDMVDLKSLSDYESLKRDSWGIPTVGSETISGRELILAGSQPLDMILMPGVAFEIDSGSGYVRRLGHGKGFYDYFLHKYKEIHGLQVEGPSTAPPSEVSLYGLALEEQLVGSETGLSVPIGEYDSFLHGLVIGDGKVLNAPGATR